MQLEAFGEETYSIRMSAHTGRETAQIVKKIIKKPLDVNVF